ncbi:MAG: putative peptidoglycan-binding domain-containing protein [Candidatus Anammoxibacter sp.]
MADVKNILNHVFKWEGGLVFFKNENQWTNKGIQYSTYQRLATKLLRVIPDLIHFKAMTNDEAVKFIEYFWNIATNRNTIKNQDAANLMFTALWGSGKYGIMEMQTGLNKAFDLNLSVDGVSGPKTVEAINSHKDAPAVLYQALEERYRRLGSQSQYAKYLRGWLNRLRELLPTTFTAASVIAALAVTFFF